MATRYVACVYSDNVITNDFECSQSERPASERECNVRECPRTEDHPNYPKDNRVIEDSYWITGLWSTVSRDLKCFICITHLNEYSSMPICIYTCAKEIGICFQSALEQTISAH